MNSKSLANTLAKLETKSSDATIKMALQKAKAQLKGKRGLRDISGLENLEGDASIISVLLSIHLGNDATDSLKELSKSDSDLADAFTDLIQLRNGVANDWENQDRYLVMTAISCKKARAWKLMPSETSKLSSTDIQEGLDAVSTPQQRESLTWLKLSALVREGSTEEALELLKSQNVEPDADMEILIPIVKKLGEEAFSWLASQIENWQKNLCLKLSQTKKSVKPCVWLPLVECMTWVHP